MKRFLYLLLCVVLLTSVVDAAKPKKFSRNKKQREVPEEQQIGVVDLKQKSIDFKPKRKEPKFRGAFAVGVIFVNFPDCVPLDPAKCLKGLAGEKGGTAADGVAPMGWLEDYYRKYSQGITWPKLYQIGKPYMAPKFRGYYCEYDIFTNPIGFKSGDEGGSRIAELCKAAKEAAYKGFKLPKDSDVTFGKDGKAAVDCWAYATKTGPVSQLEPVLRQYYPKPPEGDPEATEFDQITGRAPQRVVDMITRYSPRVRWGDPMWPNSKVQVFAEGGPGTLCHELGHVLGAPDYYHAPEQNDGVPGTPCLPWAYGPTGPAYCRAIYQAFLPIDSYPTITKSGTYTLVERKKSPISEGDLVGIFVPSPHPNYLFYIEYANDGVDLERGDQEHVADAPTGKAGLLIHVINVTMGSAFHGSPDLCYLYRPDDPHQLGLGKIGEALFTPGMSFSDSTNPSNLLPNKLRGGIAVDEITLNDDGTMSFNLAITKQNYSAQDLKLSLLPKITLDRVDELLPTSLRAHGTIIYRGEPLITEYGFVCNQAMRPTINHTKFALFHRDRYDGRITGLRPGGTYYVRAYAKNANGVCYSENEEKVTLPTLATCTNVPPLINDQFTGNWMIMRWHQEKVLDKHLLKPTALIALLKLLCYYRAPLFGTKDSDLDIPQIHTSPTLGRYAPRISEFEKARLKVGGIAQSSGMIGTAFTEDWNKNFLKTFKIKDKDTRKPVIVDAKLETIDAQSERIKTSLKNGNPILCGQHSDPFTPFSYALSWVLIDGFREGDAGLEFHLIYPDGVDRKFGKRTTGWYPLSILADQTQSVKLIFLDTLYSKKK